MKLGDDVEGTCPNCFGRGRKIHLEYNGDDEVICMVCSKLFKLEEIEEYLNSNKLKRRYKNGLDS